MYNKCETKFECGGFDCLFAKEVEKTVVLCDGGDYRCTYFQHGDCRSISAIKDALKKLGF